MGMTIRNVADNSRTNCPEIACRFANKYWQYLVESSKDDHNTVLKIQSISLETIAKLGMLSAIIGGVVGGLAGAAIGGFAGGSLWGTIGCSLGGIGGIVASKKLPHVVRFNSDFSLGDFIGFGEGIYFGTEKVKIEIEPSDHFKNWKIQALKDGTYAAFHAYIENSKELRHLICPLTLDLPMLPVKAPDGHVFEKAALELWLQEQQEGENAQDALSPDSVSFKDDLKDCREWRKEEMKAIEGEITYLNHENLSKNAIVIKGLKAALQTLKENHEIIMKKDISSIASEFVKSTVPYEILVKVVNTTTLKYG